MRLIRLRLAKFLCLASAVYMSAPLVGGDGPDISADIHLNISPQEAIKFQPQPDGFRIGGPAAVDRCRGRSYWGVSWPVPEEAAPRGMWPRAGSHHALGSHAGGPLGIRNFMANETAVGLGGGVQFVKLPNGQIGVLVTPYAGNMNARISGSIEDPLGSGPDATDSVERG